MASTLPADTPVSRGTPHSVRALPLFPPPLPGLHQAQAQEIYATYSVAVAPSLCFFDGYGHLLQLALRLTCAPDALTVVCKGLPDAEGERGEHTFLHRDAVWFLTDVAQAAFAPGAYIAAVRAHLAADWPAFRASLSSPCVPSAPIPRPCLTQPSAHGVAPGRVRPRSALRAVVAGAERQRAGKQKGDTDEKGDIDEI